MSRLHSLKAFISQRLTAAVEEVIVRLETVISEYEEEMESRHTAQRQTAGVEQHLLVKGEVLSGQQELISSLDRQDSKWPHVKEEKQEPWTSLPVRSHPQEPQEEHVVKLPSTHVHLRSKDEEESQSSVFNHRQMEDNHHVKTEPDVEDVRGPEADRTLVSGLKCLSGFDNKTIHSSESQTDDSDDYREEIRKPKKMKTNHPVQDVGHKNKLFSCSKCEKRFGQKHHLQIHMRCHTGEKPFACSLCGKRFSQKGNLKQHLTVHARQKPCRCTVCGERFSQKGNLTQHMTVHSREKT